MPLSLCFQTRFDDGRLRYILPQPVKSNERLHRTKKVSANSLLQFLNSLSTIDSLHIGMVTHGALIIHYKYNFL